MVHVDALDRYFGIRFGAACIPGNQPAVVINRRCGSDPADNSELPFGDRLKKLDHLTVRSGNEGIDDLHAVCGALPGLVPGLGSGLKRVVIGFPGIVRRKCDMSPRIILVGESVALWQQLDHRTGRQLDESDDLPRVAHGKSQGYPSAETFRVEGKALLHVSYIKADMMKSRITHIVPPIVKSS